MHVIAAFMLVAQLGWAQNPGFIWGWGSNLEHQISQGTGVSTSPVRANTSGVVAINSGGFHTLALKSDGTFVAWGGNRDGQNCNGTLSTGGFPIPVKELSGALAVAGGGIHSLVIKPDGTVWACGHNAEGQLGDGTNNFNPNPVQALGLTGVIAIAAGGTHSLALKADGTVWAWGLNTEGQLGDGTNTNRNAPVQVLGLAGVVAIAAGGAAVVGAGEHSLALKSDGTVWAWGRNVEGQLGDGTNTNHNTPVQVSGLADVVAISAGGSHNMALKSGGGVWTWGRNIEGQLGDGTDANHNTPVQVAGLLDIIAIDAGDLHSLALKPDGSVWAWGLNSLGQLGNGSIGGQVNVPGQVIQLRGAVRITAGSRHNIVIVNPIVELSSDDLNFGTAAVGGMSAPQSVNITNRSLDDLTVSSLSIGGTNPTDFIVSGPSLPVKVTKDESIAISVKFTPTARGARNAMLIVGDDGFKSPHIVSLKGTGITIEDLITAVETLSLDVGEISSLLGKLRAAQQSLARDNRNAARNQLDAFVNEINALKESGRLPSSTAQDLIAIAQIIIDSI
jgi:alpha-tubulin suppressor-like RCC1 family protein